MFRITQKDLKLIGLLISPSWLSALIGVVVGLFVCIGVIAVFTANDSSIQRQLVAWQQSQPVHSPEPYVPDPEANKPTLRNSWPLLIVWSVIGLVVYIIAGSIIHSVSKAKQIHESLGYVNANPDKMIKMEAEHIFLRVLAAISLGILVSLFIKTVLPYSITAAHASAADVLSVDGLLYALLSFAMIFVDLHLITIFLRLSLGRIRLFSDVI